MEACKIRNMFKSLQINKMLAWVKEIKTWFRKTKLLKHRRSNRRSQKMLR